MGHNTLLGSPFPRRDFGCELEPSGAQGQLVSPGHADEPVNAMRHPFEYAAADEACDGCWRHVYRIGLPARDKTPLILSDPGEPRRG
jgi:hypothetical protein